MRARSGTPTISTPLYPRIESVISVISVITVISQYLQDNNCILKASLSILRRRLSLLLITLITLITLMTLMIVLRQAWPLHMSLHPHKSILLSSTHHWPCL